MTSTNMAELRSKAKLPANQAGGNTVAAFFEANKSSIKAVLPGHINPDRMVKIALGAIRQNPMLLECTVQSLFGATVLCAQLGLEPNTPMGQCYLIPFRNRKKGITEVQFITGYKGLIDLARRSGQIESLSARAVYSNDEYDIQYGTDEKIIHRPSLSASIGEVIGFYAVAKLKDGGHQIEFISKAQIDAVMHGTQSRGCYGPWKDHYVEMGRKTAIRRICKYLPMSTELANALALDAKADMDTGQALDQVLEGDYTLDDPEAITSQVDEETGEVTDQSEIEHQESESIPAMSIPAAEQVSVETAKPAATKKKFNLVDGIE